MDGDVREGLAAPTSTSGMASTSVASTPGAASATAAGDGAAVRMPSAGDAAPVPSDRDAMSVHPTAASGGGMQPAATTPSAQPVHSSAPTTTDPPVVVAGTKRKRTGEKQRRRIAKKQARAISVRTQNMLREAGCLKQGPLPIIEPPPLPPPPPQPLVRCCAHECVDRYGAEAAWRHALDANYMDKGRRDALLQGALSACLPFGNNSSKRLLYMAASIPMCGKLFGYIWQIGDYALRSWRNHVSNHRNAPRVHKSSGASPSTMTRSEINLLNAFLISYCKRFAVPMARHRSGLEPPLPLNSREYMFRLEPGVLVRHLHDMYLRVVEEYNAREHMDIPPLSDAVFRAVLEHCSFLEADSRAAETCAVCTRLYHRVRMSHEQRPPWTWQEITSLNIPRVVVGTDLEALVRHRRLAAAERSLFLDWAAHAHERQGEFLHLCLDYTLPVELPSLLEHTGPLIFLKRLPVVTLGVCDVGRQTQCTFLWDERWGTQGVNEMSSCLLAYFRRHQPCPRVLNLSLDRLTSEETCQIVHFLFYLLAITPGLEVVDIGIMLQGHAQLMVDKFFGSMRRVLNSTDVYTIEDLALLLRSHSHESVAYNPMHIWKERLAPHFITIPSVDSVHRIRIRESMINLGLVEVKAHTLEGEWEAIKIWAGEISPYTPPRAVCAAIEPPRQHLRVPLSAESRAHYQKLLPYVPEDKHYFYR